MGAKRTLTDVLRKPNLLGMNLRIMILVCVLTPLATAHAADCTALAEPGVDWQRCYLDGRDLSRHNLSGARLRETSFQRSTLIDADLSKADAYRARFLSAAMSGANLDGGIFVEADFTRADLTGASLRDVDLRRSRFYHASLRKADLTGAKTLGADFLNADLSGARWIDGKRVCAEGSVGQCN